MSAWQVWNFGNRTIVSKELGLLGFSASKCIDPATWNFEPFSDCSSDLNCNFRPSLSHGASCLALCSYRTACEFLDEVSFESKSRNERPYYCACTFVWAIIKSYELHNSIKIILERQSWEETKPFFFDLSSPTYQFLSSLHENSEGIALGLASTFVVPNSGNSKATTRALHGRGFPGNVRMSWCDVVASFCLCCCCCYGGGGGFVSFFFSTWHDLSVHVIEVYIVDILWVCCSCSSNGSGL